LTRASAPYRSLLRLGKAYAIARRYGRNIRGRLPLFLRSFLRDHYFRAHLGDICSTPKSKWSDTNIGFKRDPVSCRGQWVGGRGCLSVLKTLYVVNVATYFSSLRMPTKRCPLQINRLSTRLYRTNHRLHAKTHCVLFTRQSGLRPLPCLFVKISILLFAAAVKFLGLLDRFLSWESHYKYFGSAFNSVTHHFESFMW
jgi:hypothetical protein